MTVKVPTISAWHQWSVIYIPEYTTDKFDVTWTSSDSSVVYIYGSLGNAYARNPGVATVTCTTGSGVTASCVVTVLERKKVDLSDASISLEQTTYTYSGSAFMPNAVVTFGGTTLRYGFDYTISYTGNINPGTATVTITGVGDYIGTATTSFTIRQLATPVPASVAGVSSGITFKWNAVSGANKYQVFRKTGSGGWARLAVATTTSYTDKTVKAGTKYTYTVRCLANDGKTYVSGYNTAGKALTYTAAPTLGTVTNTATGVKFTWKKPTGAVKYRVFRKVGSGGWKKLVDTAALSYLDKSIKSGTKYTYTVRCITSDGKVYTGGYNTTGKVIAFVTRPTISKISSTKAKSVGVWWSKVSGVTGYIIQCSTSSTFASGNKNTYVKSATAVAKTVTGLTSKKKYYVRMRTYKTVSGKNYYSAWSAAKSVTVK